MVIVSFAFALLGFTLAAFLAHMVPMLGAAAVVIGSLFGPAQVLSRLINMVFGKNLSPPGLSVHSAILIVFGVLIQQMTGNWLPGAVAVAIFLGSAPVSTASRRGACVSICSDRTDNVQ